MHHRLSTVSRKAVYFGWGVFLCVLLLPQWLFAATTDPCAGKPCLSNPIKFANLTEFLLAIVNTVVQYGAVLIVFFIVFTGFKFVTAQGNSEKVSEAKKMLTWVVVGAFVLLGVNVIKAAICGTIGKLGISVDAACKLTP